jgi:starch synthase
MSQSHKLHVVLAASEAAPFAKTGGLGDVMGSLPTALQKAGCEVIVMLPKYGFIAQRWRDQMEHVCDFNLNLGWRYPWCGIDRIVHNGVGYYFVDNEDYFKREGPYGYFDDGERFAFFSKAICESLQHIDFPCDVLHCNDWQTALVPVFLREFYQGIPSYERIRTVFTVHNVKFQGQYSDTMLGDVCGLAGIPAAARQLAFGPKTINLMKGALSYSDALTTVSPSYAEELKQPFYGEHLDFLFRERASVLHGILNGIDMEDNDPTHDTAIEAPFAADDLSGKARCKAALQAELGFEVNPERPLAVMVGRLTAQKGLDLVQYALEGLLGRSIQIAILGTGDKRYEDSLRYFDWKYHDSMRACITFDSALARRMYAGADMFLMPSLFEPCGLSQMIAMRYGTLPIVRETGGLRDSVTPYNHFTGEGNGFSFANFNGDEFRDCVLAASEVFWTDSKAWQGIMANAMGTDFGWDRAAKQYLDLYEGLCPDPDEKPSPAEKAEPTVPAKPKPAPKPAPKPKPKPAPKPAPAPKLKPAPKPAPKSSSADKLASVAAPKPGSEARGSAAKPAASSAAKAASKQSPATKRSAARPSASSAKTAPKTVTVSKPASVVGPESKSTATAKPASSAGVTSPNEPAVGTNKKVPKVPSATGTQTPKHTSKGGTMPSRVSQATKGSAGRRSSSKPSRRKRG